MKNYAVFLFSVPDDKNVIFFLTVINYEFAEFSF